MSSFIDYAGGQAGLSNGCPMDEERSSVLVQGFIQGPENTGKGWDLFLKMEVVVGVSIAPFPLLSCPSLFPGRTHTRVTIWEAARSFRSMKVKYVARKGFL